MRKTNKKSDERKQWIIIGCVSIALFIVVLIALLLGLGTKKGDLSSMMSDDSSRDDSIVIENVVFGKTYKEFRAMINAELVDNEDYSNFSLFEFKEIGTDESTKDYEYLKTNLYEAKVNNVELYVLANDKSGLISQIRFSTDIENNAGDVKLMGWLFGCTMRLMYGSSSKDGLNEVMNSLDLEHPYEGMNITHTYNKNIFRSKLENNIWTIYITDTDLKFTEENKVAITTYEEQARREAEEAEKERRAEEQAWQELAKKERIFTAGNYKVGSDIDPGTYNIVTISGRGNCFVHNASGRSVVNEIFATVEDSFYIKEYKNVDLSFGYTIEIGSSLKLKFVPVK